MGFMVRFGMARRGAIRSGEGFKMWCGLLKWGKAGRGMVLQGFLGEVKCGMAW